MATKKYVSLTRLEQYDEKIKKFLADADSATLDSAKAYADGLSVNYDAAGAAATAESNAKGYTDGKISEVNTTVAGVKTIAEQGVADAATAQSAAEAAQADVDALEAYVGTIPEGATATNVVAYVQEKTAGIATEGAMTELGNRVTVVEGDVATIKGDYLKASDKTELEGKITAAETAVATEKSRAEGIEAGLRTDVDAIKADYLKAADKTSLQDQITANANAITLLTDGIDSEKVDGVKDLIAYVEEHGTEVTGMKEDIAENAAAIAAEAERAKGEEAKNAQAAAAAKTAADNAQADADAEAERAKGVESGLDTRIAAVEAAVGESGSVADDIDAAKDAAIAAAAADAATKDEAVLAAAKKYADDEDALIEARVATLESASATHALASDLTALTGRVTTAEGKVGTLETEMDAVEAKAAANETAIGTLNTTVATKASQEDLNKAVERIAANETAIANFVEVSEEEINGLFA